MRPLIIIQFLLVTPLFLFSQVFSGGINFSIVRCGNGYVYTYGDNQYGQIGDNTAAVLRDVPTQVVGPGGVGFLSNIIAVCSGGSAALHSLVLKNDNTVWGWGLNNNGQLGDNTTTQRNAPVQVKDNPGTGFLTGIVAIASGNLFSLALKNDGTVWAWGDNSSGQLGDNTTTDRYTPVQVKDNPGTGFLTGVKAISAGNLFSMALKTDGTVWAWGGNARGSCGDNTTTDRLTPVQVKDAPGTGYLSGITVISASDRYGAACKNDGSVWCWGWNSDGQLGDNTTTERHLPVQMKDPPGTGYLSGIDSIAAGYSHMLCLKNDGTVWAVGNNTRGQLGDNTTTERHLPVQVKDNPGTGYLTGVKEISGGDRFSMAWKNDNTVWGWGWNTKGALGDGTNGNQRQTPVQPTNALCGGGALFPLPVQWLGFQVEIENNGVVIEWSTASESNNAWFYIERSEDGVEFREIGIVPGAGNSSSLRTYNFNDELVPLRKQYYRIKQVDHNGEFSYSSVRSLKVENIEDITVYPNINNGSFTVSSTEKVIQEVIVSNVYGEKMFAIINAPSPLLVSLDDKPNGIYLAEVRSGNKVIAKKIVISR